MSWRFLLSQISKGHEAGRALIHQKVRDEVNPQGVVLDVGGGRLETYLRFMDLSKSELISLDLEFTGPQVCNSTEVLGSVTSLPFASGSVNTVLCFNLLEHVFDYRTAIAEIHRVMAEDGVLYGWIPFMFHIHAGSDSDANSGMAPRDYWRFTDQGLIAVLAETGFKQVKAENTGSAFLAIFDILRPYYRFKFVRILFAAGALFATGVVTRIAKRMNSDRPFDAPCGVWFVATKKRPPYPA